MILILHSILRITNFDNLKFQLHEFAKLKNYLDLQHDCFDELNPSSPFNMK